MEKKREEELKKAKKDERKPIGKKIDFLSYLND